MADLTRSWWFRRLCALSGHEWSHWSPGWDPCGWETTWRHCLQCHATDTRHGSIPSEALEG